MQRLLESQHKQSSFISLTTSLQAVLVKALRVCVRRESETDRRGRVSQCVDGRYMVRSNTIKKPQKKTRALTHVYE